MFNKNHVGEKVWSLEWGNGIIKAVDNCLTVTFENNEDKSFQIGGSYSPNGERVLFFGHNLKVVGEVIPCPFKVGDKVWVRYNCNALWNLRIFHSMADYGSYYVFDSIQSVNEIDSDAKWAPWNQCVPFDDMPMDN